MSVSSARVAAPPFPIRVMVADDHQIVRAGIRILLGPAPDIDVVGEAEDGLEAVALIARLAPHVAVLDIDMPRMDGLAATRALVAQGSPTRVLILTMLEDEQTMTRAVWAGAAGFLTKRAAETELMDAIRAIAGGSDYLRRPGVYGGALPFLPAPSPRRGDRGYGTVPRIARGHASLIAPMARRGRRWLRCVRRRLHGASSVVRLACTAGMGAGIPPAT